MIEVGSRVGSWDRLQVSNFRVGLGLDVRFRFSLEVRSDLRVDVELGWVWRSRLSLWQSIEVWSQRQGRVSQSQFGVEVGSQVRVKVVSEVSIGVKSLLDRCLAMTHPSGQVMRRSSGSYMLLLFQIISKCPWIFLFTNRTT